MWRPARCLLFLASAPTTSEHALREHGCVGAGGPLQLAHLALLAVQPLCIHNGTGRVLLLLTVFSPAWVVGRW